MKARLKNILKKWFEPKAMVLMYHRVAALDADVWDIAVSPSNFEKQLQELQGKGKVVPLEELVKDLEKGRIRDGSIAITFDDGYVDNYVTAKPLLEKYSLPATFFIASGNIGKASEFWWDALEHLLLFAERLPTQLEITISGKPIRYDLGAEAELSQELRQKHQQWKATAAPPATAREKLYYLLWENMRPLQHDAQQAILEQLKAWASVPVASRPGYRSMTREQLQELGQSRFITVGAHTVTHPALADQAFAYQQEELQKNEQYLESQTGRAVHLLAYPYGNYNQESIKLAGESGFRAAFTTEARVVTARSGLHQLPRFQVKNLQADDFKKQLKQWGQLW